MNFRVRKLTQSFCSVQLHDIHFFKSFSDAARINLNIRAEGDNEHHKIEGIFKALARSIKMAVKRDIYKYQLPSSKGTL